MVKSMTGFGRGEQEKSGRSFNVEIKTVNHKYSDISIRMPRQLSYLEDNDYSISFIFPSNHVN